MEKHSKIIFIGIQTKMVHFAFYKLILKYVLCIFIYMFKSQSKFITLTEDVPSSSSHAAARQNKAWKLGQGSDFKDYFLL